MYCLSVRHRYRIDDDDVDFSILYSVCVHTQPGPTALVQGSEKDFSRLYSVSTRGETWLHVYESYIEVVSLRNKHLLVPDNA
jgi:hypothetical protein